MNDAPALFETRAAGGGKQVGFATLNAEKSLNALSLPMADLLFAQLREWENHPDIACVVLQGAGDRAFCAGGDIVALYQSLSDENPDNRYRYADRFFEQEYRLDYLLHTYSKPILCWGHGIVMGGGLGLMAGASHRVVTERSRVAAPEVTIGLFPDVGGSWFLNRMPGRTGLYLGLTGTNLNAADALFVKLADYYVESAGKQALFDDLLTVAWGDGPRQWHNQLSAVLRRHRGGGVMAASPVREHIDFINEATDCDSVEEVLAAVTVRAADDAWVDRGAKALQNGSPASAKVIFETYRRAVRLSAAEVFALELGLAYQFCRHPDFREGVRALLIDKDNQPKWSPPTLAAVSVAYVEEHFVQPWPIGGHPFEAHALRAADERVGESHT
ncbi:MAG: enoyl-CoA hydratase/isomerase family protein [Chloroflexi bacterium]|nr:enoyl-CoA hydratase/isomerase family protein [Chloroflexota bacterium]